MKYRLHRFTQPSPRRLLITLGAIVSLHLSTVNAETIRIPLGQQGKAWQVETPRHGITKLEVEAQFGAPQDRTGPVGEPPIYTWDYDRFTVYFEGDHVIHSVVKFDPANP